jgi:hypothetical protein
MYQDIDGEYEIQGPDVTADPYATFAADVWGTLIGSPTGRFKNSYSKRFPGHTKKSISRLLLYAARRGCILFDTFLFSKGNAADTALRFTEAVQRDEGNAE